jgi:hypothetical protein
MRGRFHLRTARAVAFAGLSLLLTAGGGKAGASPRLLPNETWTYIQVHFNAQVFAPLEGACNAAFAAQGTR